MILQILSIASVFVLLPFLVGHCFAQGLCMYQKREFTSYVYRYLTGNIVLWSIFQGYTVPFIGKGKTLSELILAWLITSIVFCAFCLFIGRVRRNSILMCSADTGSTMEKDITNSSKEKNDRWITIGISLFVIIVIGWQCYKYIFCMYLNMDDATYIAYATDAWDTNLLYRIYPHTGESLSDFSGIRTRDITSPWPLFLALLARIAGYHPAIVAHTIVPVFLLLASYSSFWMIGNEFFSNDIRKKVTFVLFVSVILSFFGGSTRTQGTAVLMRIWQGKAVVASVMIPAVFFLLMHLYKCHDKEKTSVYIMLTVSGFAGCLLSGAGIVTIPILVVVYAGWNIFISKNRNGIWPLVCCMVPSIMYGMLNVFLDV